VGGPGSCGEAHVAVRKNCARAAGDGAAIGVFCFAHCVWIGSGRKVWGGGAQREGRESEPATCRFHSPQRVRDGTGGGVVREGVWGVRVWGSGWGFWSRLRAGSVGRACGTPRVWEKGRDEVERPHDGWCCVGCV
jgi:hypothetical protein